VARVTLYYAGLNNRDFDLSRVGPRLSDNITIPDMGLLAKRRRFLSGADSVGGFLLRNDALFGVFNARNAQQRVRVLTVSVLPFPIWDCHAAEELDRRLAMTDMKCG